MVNTIITGTDQELLLLVGNKEEWKATTCFQNPCWPAQLRLQGQSNDCVGPQMVSLNTRDACLVLNTDMGEAKEEEHTSIKHTYKKAHIAPAQIPQHFNQPPTAGADIPALHGGR